LGAEGSGSAKAQLGIPQATGNIGGALFFRGLKDLTWNVT
jgi:hypothetical protein